MQATGNLLTQCIFFFRYHSSQNSKSEHYGRPLNTKCKCQVFFLQIRSTKIIYKVYIVCVCVCCSSYTITEHFIIQHYTNTDQSLHVLPKQPQFFVAWIPLRNIPLRFRSLLTCLHHAVLSDFSGALSCCESPIPPHSKGVLLEDH